MENGSDLVSAGIGVGFTLFIVVLVAGMMILDGIALWKAARRGSRGWFIALFLTNTIILELLYIFVFSKEQGEQVIDRNPPAPPPSNNPQRPA